MPRFALFSTMDQEPRKLSNHSTLRGAARAQDKLNKAVKRGNPGGNSYYPTSIRHGDGTPLTDEEHAQLMSLAS